MKCQKCPKQATLHITEVINDEHYEELHLCEDCAQRAGKDRFVLEALPPTKVRNREAPVEIYRVLEARD